MALDVSVIFAFCAGKCMARAAACRATALGALQRCTPNWETFFLEPLTECSVGEAMPDE